MGSSLYMYLGPYLMVKPLKVFGSTPRKTCMNVGCSNHTVDRSIEDAYCRKCGNKIYQREVKVEKEPLYDDLFHYESELEIEGLEYKEHENQDGSVAIIMECQEIRDRTLAMTSDGNDTKGLDSIMTETIIKDCQHFENRFGMEMVLIMERCERIELRWGVVRYVN